MDKRILGTGVSGGGLEVSALGFGYMGMSQSYGPGPDRVVIATKFGFDVAPDGGRPGVEWPRPTDWHSRGRSAPNRVAS